MLPYNHIKGSHAIFCNSIFLSLSPAPAKLPTVAPLLLKYAQKIISLETISFLLGLREYRISLSHLKTLAYLYLISMFGSKSQHCCEITQHWTLAMWNNGVSILLRDGEADGWTAASTTPSLPENLHLCFWHQ